MMFHCHDRCNTRRDAAQSEVAFCQHTVQCMKIEHECNFFVYRSHLVGLSMPKYVSGVSDSFATLLTVEFHVAACCVAMLAGPVVITGTAQTEHDPKIMEWPTHPVRDQGSSIFVGRCIL